VRWELVEPVSDGVHMRTTIEGLLGLSRTVLAADGGKVEDIELAALRDTASTESRVDLSQGDRGACGEGEEGSGELHDGCGLSLVGWLIDEVM
jgi:hypothetical protein